MQCARRRQCRSRRSGTSLHVECRSETTQLRGGVQSTQLLCAVPPALSGFPALARPQGQLQQTRPAGSPIKGERPPGLDSRQGPANRVKEAGPTSPASVGPPPGSGSESAAVRSNVSMTPNRLHDHHCQPHDPLAAPKRLNRRMFNSRGEREVPQRLETLSAGFARWSKRSICRTRKPLPDNSRRAGHGPQCNRRSPRRPHETRLRWQVTMHTRDSRIGV